MTCIKFYFHDKHILSSVDNEWLEGKNNFFFTFVRKSYNSGTCLLDKGKVLDCTGCHNSQVLF